MDARRRLVLSNGIKLNIYDLHVFSWRQLQRPPWGSS